MRESIPWNNWSAHKQKRELRGELRQFLGKKDVEARSKEGPATSYTSLLSLQQSLASE
ncbi:hypothetical protein J6590_086009 [Homalodisca vitripennis]|nr:hypothetical protein J6590_086009 [Homalodisca vitripennis]